MDKKLTIKQRKFIKYYIETGNASQSALKAGYATRQSAFDVLSNPVIKDLFQQLIENEGITDKKLAEVLNKGLSANKVVGYLQQHKKDENGQLEKVKPDEVVSNEFVEIPDYTNRHRYLETALKLKNKMEDTPLVQISELTKIYLPERQKDGVETPAQTRVIP